MNMKVILTQKVSNLGNIGDVVQVSNGYARNYLFPKRLAMFADKGSESTLAHHKKALKQKISAEKDAATSLKNQLDKIILEFSHKAGGSGSLFGSITNSDIAQSLSEKGFEIERKLIVLETPIKKIGQFKAIIKLFTDVHATVSVVVKKEEEAISDTEETISSNKKSPKAKKKKEAVQGDHVSAAE